jgi:hypothetical protein
MFPTRNKLRRISVRLYKTSSKPPATAENRNVQTPLGTRRLFASGQTDFTSLVAEAKHEPCNC